MLQLGQKVSADDIYMAGWIIDSHSEYAHSTSYVSPDGTLTATIYDGQETDIEIGRND